MTLNELEAYLTSHYGAETDHSFKEDSSVIVFSRADNHKWFAAAKNIGCRSVNVARDGRVDIVNVKLGPRVVSKLRTREGYRPAWRMNQNSWVTILLDGSVPDEEIRAHLDAAFVLAGKTGRR